MMSTDAGSFSVEPNSPVRAHMRHNPPPAGAVNRKSADTSTVSNAADGRTTSAILFFDGLSCFSSHWMLCLGLVSALLYKRYCNRICSHIAVITGLRMIRRVCFLVDAIPISTAAIARSEARLDHRPRSNRRLGISACGHDSR